jgi:hypothetical protein
MVGQFYAKGGLPYIARTGDLNDPQEKKGDFQLSLE